MGILGWGAWLTAEIEKYKLLRDSATTEAEVAVYDKIIADLEAKEAE